MTKPILILAFADYRTDRDRDLRELDEEQYQLREVLKPVEGRLCRVIFVPGASVEKIVKAFDEAEGPVVGFHFAGHADEYRLLLRESAEGPAFAAFLGRQPALKFVFLNACSTRGHVTELHRHGVPVVIATSNSIDDRVAREFAVSFYRHLAKGKSIQTAFHYYETIEEIKGAGDRGFQLHQESDQHYIHFPWKLDCREGAEATLEWSLSVAARDPLFGLPPVPAGYDLPQQPFRYLERFERRHARVFFGRGYQIKELYDRVVDQTLAPVVLFYGQSGVGKSSLLEAGLLPRLEEGFVVQHFRRDEERGLSGDLSLALHADIGKDDLREAWQTLESKDGKPLIVILDQVEEAFTKPPAEGGGEELPTLLEQLRQIFLDPENRPEGKIILAYRKEYHSDLKSLLRAFALPHTDVFLQKLDQAGIEEAITGLTREEDLRRQYGLTIADERLPAIIADDLLEDAASAIAPVLQILLTKMWEEASRADPAHPVFSTALYQQKKREGYLLYDFLEQKLREVARWNRETVESGLVLDLLMFHTTPRSTANRRGLTEIIERYAHRRQLIQELLFQIRDRYLIVDVHGAETPDSPDFSLAHDTLAPIIREEYEKSDRPGQLAERILGSHLKEWRRDPESALLDETSLQLVQAGRNGMRVWLVDEEKMVEQSRRRIEREKRFRRRVRFGAIAAALALLVFGTLFWLNRREVVRQAYELESNGLIDEGQNLLATDPTRALELIYQGWRMDTADLLKSNIFFGAYRENVLYDSLTLFRESAGDLVRAAFSADGAYFATAAGADVQLYAYRDTGIVSIAKFTEAKNTISSLVFSPDGSYLLAGSLDRNVYRWPVDGQGVDSFPTPKSMEWRAVESIAVSSDNHWVALGYESGDMAIWHPGDTLLNRRLETPAVVESLVFYPDNPAILAGTATGEIIRYQVSGEAELLFRAADRPVIALDISPDGENLLAATSGDFSLWKQTDGFWRQQYVQDRFSGSLRNVHFVAGGQLVLTAGASTVGRVWNAGDGDLLYTLRGHTGNLRQISARPEAGRLLTAAEDNTIRQWLLPPLGFQNRKLLPNYLLSSLAPVMVDDYSTAAGTLDGEVILINTLNGKEVLVHEAHRPYPVTALAYEPRRRLLISGDQQGQLLVFRLTATDPVEVLRDSLHQGAVRALGLSPDGEWMASASSDSTAVLLRLETRERIVLRGHSQEVTGVAFSPDGGVLLTSSLDQSVRSWGVSGGRFQYLYPHSADHTVTSIVAVTGDKILDGTVNTQTTTGQLNVWSREAASKPWRSYSLSAGVESISSLPGSRLVTVALLDGRIQLRDTEGNLLRQFSESGAGGYRVTHALLSPDKRQVIGLTDAGELIIWRNEHPLPTDFFDN